MPDTLSADPELRAQNVPVGFEDVTLGADFTFVNTKIRGIYVGTTGTIIASTDGTNFHTFVGCTAGSILMGAFKKVKSTGNGTTASNLVGCI